MTGFNNSNQVEAPDYSGYFIGTVVANNDPTFRQRIKVTIPELLTGAEPMLPWVAPVLQSEFGVTPSAGVMQVPAIGSVVRVEFQNGELYYGLASGYLHTANHSPASELLVNYPARHGWKDPAGNLFYVDHTSGQVDVHFRHVSGTTIHIANDGNVSVTTPQSLIVTATNNVTVNCVNATVNASASVAVNTPLTAVSGNMTVGGTVVVGGAISAGGSIAAGGNISTPADVTAGSISLKTHVHGGVRSGTSDSAVPH